MTDEVWSPIPFYPIYQASSQGRIRSLPRWVVNRGGWALKPGTVLIPRANTTDRLQVTLYRDGEAVPKSVHSLVCSAFHGPSPVDRPGALHQNGDHRDNRPENLYWGTPKENSEDATRHGRNFEANKTHCNRGHEFTTSNTYIRPDGGGRQCRECIRIRSMERSEKKRLDRTMEAMKDD